MSSLYIVATPIGNLGDISFRAIETLRKVDLILCEDTRTTKKILSRYGINTPTLSYHQHSKLKKIRYIIDALRKGKDLALVSDAGTPGLSDPGNRLVEEIVKSLADSVKIVPLPGPSAVTAALSISGFPADSFIFMGFPPRKKKRKSFFNKVFSSKRTVVFYESPYRILKSLKDLKLTQGFNPQETKLVVCRELTKRFETIYRGTVDKVTEEIKKDKVKGEFVVVVRN